MGFLCVLGKHGALSWRLLGNILEAKSISLEYFYQISIIKNKTEWKKLSALFYASTYNLLRNGVIFITYKM